jgi:hypothetical protein
MEVILLLRIANQNVKYKSMTHQLRHLAQVYATLGCFVVVALGFLVLCAFRIPLLSRARWLSDLCTKHVQPQLQKLPARFRRNGSMRSPVGKTDPADMVHSPVRKRRAPFMRKKAEGMKKRAADVMSSPVTRDRADNLSE